MTATLQMTDADKKYGYEFGCDGLASPEEACELIAGICKDTLYQLCNEGKLRKGKMPERRTVGICRRSIRDYIRSMEV